jgi:hypothetical protein
MSAATVIADTLGPVQYDPKRDQLIITMFYDGTNPNHHFSIQWGRCHKLRDQLHEPAHQIIYVSIVNEQGDDAAIKSYTKVIRVPLAGLSCRPATVTVWTSKNSYASLDIP